MTLPPGVGKSLLAVAYAKLMGGRVLILTSTKGLMKQYEDYFTKSGLMGVRGMNNYPCKALGGNYKCDTGPCLDGEQCPWKEKGCDYYDQVKWTAERDIALTNYSYWFAHPTAFALGSRDILICDEAHEIPRELSAAAGASFHSGEIQLRQEMGNWAIEDWILWAAEKREQAAEMLERGHLTLSHSEKRVLRSLYARLNRVVDSVNGETPWAWNWNTKPSLSVDFEPVDPGPYAESLLFRMIPKVVLMSATIREITIKDLGIKETDYALIEAPSPFPVVNRPIWWHRIGIRLTAKTSDVNQQFWVSKIDQDIHPRLPWKGIIHTVSYSRARYIQEVSKFGQYMIIHDPSNTRETVERFKRMPEGKPAILLSPAIHTGWDFPLETARWQIISKVPFPNTSFGIALARKNHDSQYAQKHAIAVIQQMAGRIVRSETDYGETIITDDSIDWLYRHYKPYYSRWFRESFDRYGGVDIVPPPQMRG